MELSSAGCRLSSVNIQHRCRPLYGAQSRINSEVVWISDLQTELVASSFAMQKPNKAAVSEFVHTMAMLQFNQHVLHAMLSCRAERRRGRVTRNEAIVTISKEISQLSILKGKRIHWRVGKYSQVCDFSWENIKCISNTENLINKNTSLMHLISIYFTYSKSLHVSGRILPIIRRIWYCTYQRLVLVR